MKRLRAFFQLVLRPGKPMALPGDSSSMTIPREGSGVDAKVAPLHTPALSTPIALTPSPSPIRWARVAGERENPRLSNGEADAHGLGLSLEMFLPLLGGEGRGEGETDVPTKGCVPIVASAGGLREGPYGFEPFIVSSLRLGRKLLIPGLAGLLLALGVGSLPAETFLLPTTNRALLHHGHEDEFFVGTAGKPWISGTFGCVRTDGWQMHEGLDIRCLQRDRRNEPVDPVMATADGVVAYVNTRTSLSNYGNYIVLRHQIEGLEVYSLYAHLSEVRAGLKPNANVKAGEPIAVMGRTSNTRQRISQERAHVHFELNFLVNEQFALWYKKNNAKERNDHGAWNGQNLIGIDPSRVLFAQQAQGDNFKLLKFVQTQAELCRVQVRDTSFPWLKRYPALIQRNATAEKEGIAGYEMALNFNGLPFLVIPRASSELKAKSKFHLLSVNEAEQQKNPCRRLVARRNGHWELGSHGQELLDLLTF